MEHDITEEQDCQNGPGQDKNSHQGVSPAFQRHSGATTENNFLVLFGLIEQDQGLEKHG